MSTPFRNRNNSHPGHTPSSQTISPSKRREYISDVRRPQSPPDMSQLYPSPAPRSYLPYNFGAEFEIIIKPKAVLGLDIPESDASARERRIFNHRIIKAVVDVLQAVDLDAAEPDPDELPTYKQWTVHIDGSLSKEHTSEGFYPVEIVMPITKAEPDGTWLKTIDHFWTAIRSNFELRRDSSCGFHVHISMANLRFSDEQLRQIAKAIIYWEPLVTACLPPSRSSRVSEFCQSNLQEDVPSWMHIINQGPLRGLREVSRHIDTLSRDALIGFICPGSRRAWNLSPALGFSTGSIEFRRPPGVTDAKKSKHWIAFVMSFVDMAMRCNPCDLLEQSSSIPDMTSVVLPSFEAPLLSSAKALGIQHALDPRLIQPDNPRSLYLHPALRTNNAAMQYLRGIDADYGYLNPEV